MCSEDAVLQRLRCHPSDGQQTLPSFPVVVGLIDVSGHTKVWKENINQTPNYSQTCTNYQKDLVVVILHSLSAVISACVTL